LAKGPCRLARPLFSATPHRRLEQKLALEHRRRCSNQWCGQSALADSVVLLRLVTDGAFSLSASLARSPAISPLGDGRRFLIVGQPGSFATKFADW